MPSATLAFQKGSVAFEPANVGDVAQVLLGRRGDLHAHRMPQLLERDWSPLRCGATYPLSRAQDREASAPFCPEHLTRDASLPRRL